MGRVPMNDDGVTNQNNHMCYEQREVGNGLVGEGQALGLSEEDESRIDDVAIGVNNSTRGAIQVHDGLQILQQLPAQGPVVQWDRFLPIRSLKVLLVENDDSTRHIVSALLQNCSYEVTAVANGLQAWKLLEDLTSHIDLILSEVAMPILSGISLLCKIMSHKTLKNIPVIMMSSHDSMNIVFKCLSKGAVDFLAKPIRKNELKNLWQHVWRRCHSSSSSGIESGTHTKNSEKSKSTDESENNTSSSDEHYNGSKGLSNQDGSDNGSGTQSSWTKRATEHDSHQPKPHLHQFTDAADSTCAQVISKTQTFSSNWIHANEMKEGQEQDEQQDNNLMGKDLELGVPRNPDLQSEYQCQKLSSHLTGKRPDVDYKPFDRGQLEQKNANIGKHDQATNIPSAIADSANTQPGSEYIDAANGPSNISQVNDNVCCDSGQMAPLKLTVKGLRGVGDNRNVANDDHNVLRHSDLSAFSKYNTVSSAIQALKGNLVSCSPFDNSSDSMKTEMMQNFPSSNGTPLNQQSNGSSNYNDMASAAKYVIPKPEAFIEKSESVSAFKPFHSAFQPVQNSSTFSSQRVLAEKADEVGTGQARLKGSQQVRVQHHHHHHHHYHHHVHKMQQHQQLTDRDDLSPKDMAVIALPSGSSNVFDGLTEGTEGNVGNYSVNGSASGSNHGSNVQNGSSVALNAELTNMESDNGAAGNSGAGGITGRTSGSGADDGRTAQREAALLKFRQKRKERCFEKKVRYQSRKKLAEQRPRVKGQFVRQGQIISDSKAGNEIPSSDLVSDDNSWDSLR
ncbi:Response_reg domain-containing protein/CCT domain-containing protein [Cephalotus follicularis]|uniref:Response_reg domain-containing protein/CCT domain-containing protein n=1 Tax=Cephalotus follicularis TaxID=3775 RepID=A0A1Q3BTS5_CEPFO|nr:Response_reg domain-containing protein/CCT domain-containing protein [Cephalotus follicularis]